MDQQILDKIKQAVHTDYDWKADDVRVDEVERLRRGNCSFYTAAHRVRPLSFQPSYAVLPGGVVVGSADNRSVAKILDACSADAPAGWWAEIIARFHPDLGSAVVLQNETQNAAAVRKIQSADRRFAPPAMISDAGGQTVTFYMLDPESFTVYSVKALRKSDGSVAIDKSELQ